MLARGAVHNPGIFRLYKEYYIENEVELIGDNVDLMNEYEELDSNESNKNSNHELKETLSNTNMYGKEDPKVSQKLTKVIERKYQKDNIKFDIMPILKEYIEIALKCGNQYKNTKYNLLYILKTHKDYINLFQKIQNLKDYKNICKILGMEEEYDKITKEKGYLQSFYDGSHYRHKK